MSDPTICIVTRGDVDLGEIEAALEPLGWPTIVYDNSKEIDYAVAGRYAAVNWADTDLVYVQDDDCVLEADAVRTILAAWTPGAIAANMPAAFRHDFYTDHCLVGFGAVFEREFAESSMARAYAAWPDRDPRALDRTCDIALTYLSPERILVDVPYRNLEWAEAPNRMWMQPGHVSERKRTLEWLRETIW
jgi:hypothetical protein